MTAARGDAIGRALGYPYSIPERSYELHADGPRPLNGAGDLGARTPVLACGSNLSPEQLTRKFGEELAHSPIPVVKGTLHDFDSVYSAHFSRYGSVAATLHPSPGTRVDLAVTYLTAAQLRRMHRTESLGVNYGYGRLDNIVMVLETGEVLDSVHAYIGLRGALTVDGSPVALQAVTARRRHYPAMEQPRVQACLRDRLAPQTGLSDFVLGNVECEETRTTRIRGLAASAKPFRHQHFKPQPPRNPAHEGSRQG